MLYFVTVMISVLILGTLFYFSNYRERKRVDIYSHWNKYPFIDKGRFHFPVWCYLIAGLISTAPYKLNLISCAAIILLYIIHSNVRYSDRDGYDLVETRLYIKSPFLDVIIKFLNKRV